jgi:hypothetical protein
MADLRLVHSVGAECAACGKPAALKASGEPLHTIHRDGFSVGPDVALCEDCGAHELPDCPTLWAMISERRKAKRHGR